MANTNGFNLEVGTILNTSNIPKDLEKVQAKLVKTIDIPIRIKDVNNETGEVVWSKAVKALKTYKDELGNTYNTIVKLNQEGKNFVHIDGTVEQEKLQKITEKIKVLTTETHKWTDSSGAIQKWTTTVNDAGEVVSKRTKEYSDGLGNLITETTYWTRNSKGQWEQIGETVRNITDDVKQATTVISTETHKWTDTSGAIQKWVTTVDDAGNVVSNRTKQYKNDIGELVTETTKWTKNEQGQWQQVGETIKTVTDDYKQATNIISTETQKFVDSKGAIQTWVTTIDDAGNKVFTRTKEIVDSMGRITQTTSKFITEGGKLKKVGDDVVKISNILTDVSTTTTKTFGQIIEEVNGVEKTFNGTITTIKKVSSNGEELTTVISKYRDELGRTIEKTEQFNKVGDKVAPTMRNIINAAPVNRTETKTFIDADGVQTVVQYANGVRVLTTQTREYTNSLRELVTETKVFEGEEQRLVSVDEKKIRNVQQERQEESELINTRFNLREETQRLREEEERLNNALVSTTTTHSQGRTTQFGDDSGREYDALVTRIERVDAANRRVIETTYEFTNAQGQLVRQTRITDAENHKLAEDTIEISDANQRATDSNNRLAQSTNNVANAQRNMGSALGRALRTLTQYYLASLPIRAVQTAITETIQTLRDFDSALIEFRKVSDLAGESLTSYVAKLAEMGEVTGSTMQAMVEASTQFRKSGYSDEDSAKLASIAEKYRNIADEEIDAGEAASFIIAQMKAFNIEAGQAEHIIDAVYL